jgi:hypothetical protein
MIKKNIIKKLNISNKLIYTLIAIFSFLFIGVGVYAYGTSTTMHNIDTIAPPAGCASGQLGMVSGSWGCFTPTNTNDVRLTIDSKGYLCYPTTAYCSTSQVNCQAYQYLTTVVSDCSSMSQDTLETICSGVCNEDYGYACNGQDPTGNCGGGTVVNYAGSGWCEGGGTIECMCDGYATYTQARHIPAGTRCI